MGASSVWVVSVFLTVPTTLPSRSTVIRSQMVMTSYQFMADKNDRHAVLAQPGQGFKQHVHFLRHQHGGGLVQDQNSGVAVKRLEDFDALPLAHRKVAHQRVRL